MGEQNKRVLIVDDEPNIIIPIEFLMKEQGYQVDTALNGKIALSKMETFSPDVVILDVMMPEMNGFEVARQIRSNESHNQVHIVFLTAKGTDADRLSGYDSGGEVYLTKPFENSELVEVVNDLISL